MAAFLVLVLPVPFKLRRQLVRFLRRPSTFLAQLRLSLRFTFLFVLILFIDAANRVVRVQGELRALHQSHGTNGGLVVGVDRAEINVRRFYGQRNLYLTGFVLWLGLVLRYTFHLVERVVAARDALHQHLDTSVSGQNQKQGDPTLVIETDSAATTEEEVVRELKKKLEEIEEERKRVLARYGQLAGEYGELVADGKVEM